MKIVCAHCQEEGKLGFLGETEPREDPTITYDLCPEHRLWVLEEQARLKTEALRRQQKEGRSERRRFERLPVSVPALCRTPQFRGTEVRGIVRYVSAGGLMVELPVEVVPGSLIRLILPTRSGPLEVEGRVMWTAVNGTTIRHGLAFREPKAPDFAVDLFLGEKR